ncbi:MAG: hypothetical protein QY320_03615 [Gammaproteobacteria bacterium]|nr:MAG: hypothetical protein QY320_03615 [Gammaproteobacteria bacterium]
MSADLPRPWRVPLLMLAMLSLAAGALAGLVRIGWQTPAPGAASVMDHAVLMIGAFFGTVISLERAVALGALWAYGAPLLAGLSGLAMLTGAGDATASALLSAASLLLLGASVQVFLRQRALHTLTLALGAAAWTAGNLLWLDGAPVTAAVAPWMAFLVLTIAGERLELSRFLPPSPAARWLFSAIVIALLIAMLPGAATVTAGRALYPAALLALALWLLRQDIARRTVREHGLTRFIAICLLAGYAWLATGALILLTTGGILPGTTAYDAGLHAVMLGFVFSMVFGHAPIIFPAVLGLRLPYHAMFYVPLVVLHLSVLIRVAGTLAGAAQVRSSGGMLNAVALALFVLGMIVAIIRGQRASRA